MLIQEVLEENKDLIKTYSDAGKYVVNGNGDKYAEAIDLAEFINKGIIVYVESDEVIPAPEEGELTE